MRTPEKTLKKRFFTHPSKWNKYRNLLIIGLFIMSAIIVLTKLFLEINACFVFSKKLKTPLGFVQNFFRTKDPNKPCIEMVIPSGFLGESEQAARLSIAMDRLEIDHYTFHRDYNVYRDYRKGGKSGWFEHETLHKIVHALFNPDFRFYLSIFTYGRPLVKNYSYIWNTTIGPTSPITCLDFSFKGHDGYIDVNPNHEWLSSYLIRKKDFALIEHFVPSACSTHFSNAEPKTLFYCGMAWDKKRGIDYLPLFKKLQANGKFVVYGPQKAWQDFGESYKGQIPFDGISLIDKIREAGIALCLHSEVHNKNGIPTGRVFEAAAAHAIIISDRNPYIEKYFGNNVLYIDRTDDLEKLYTQIQAHQQWIYQHPVEAKQLANQANKIFTDNFTMEKNVLKLINLHKQVMQQKNK